MRRWQRAVCPLFMLALVAAGCARRPSTPQASAPSPAGSTAAGVGASEEPGPSGGVSEAPGPGGTVEPGNGTGGGATVTGPASAETSRAGQPGPSPPAGGAPAVSPGRAEAGTTAPAGEQRTAAAPPAPTEYSALAELRDIHFDFDKYTIRPDDGTVLDANAEWLNSNLTYLVLIEGHCDERGTNEYNLALGQHRAKSTRDYFVAHGIAASRITTISYGEERPLCAEHTEECWARNRRAHFLVKAR